MIGIIVEEREMTSILDPKGLRDHGAEEERIERAPGQLPPRLSRFGFHFLCVFVLLALADTYEPWNMIPAIGSYLSQGLDFILSRTAIWAASHLFHISGIAAVPHPTDSRDTALGWITMLVISVLAFLAAALWSLLDRRQRDQTAVADWMRYLVRLALFFTMLRYGIFKIFPLQMSRPSLAVLNEPLGQSSPMTLLWTLIGLRPSYQIFSGVLESLCAVLLFFRRTALMGTVLGVVVMSNVVLLNFCFDVPVKLGAMLILFAFVVLLWPDFSELTRFFWKHQPAALHTAWRPDFRSANTRRIASALEITYVLLCVYAMVPYSYHSAVKEAANVQAPSPLSGEWQVDSARAQREGHAVDAPVLTGEGLPMTALYLEPDGKVMARSSDGRLWRAGTTIDPARHTLKLFSYYFQGERFQANYHYTQTDKDHLRLEPLDAKASESTLLLTRVPLPATYPLLQTPFHWVEEWALER
jgi:hypothetical protein